MAHEEKERQEAEMLMEKSIYDSMYRDEGDYSDKADFMHEVAPSESWLESHGFSVASITLGSFKKKYGGGYKRAMKLNCAKDLAL